MQQLAQVDFAVFKYFCPLRAGVFKLWLASMLYMALDILQSNEHLNNILRITSPEYHLVWICI